MHVDGAVSKVVAAGNPQFDMTKPGKQRAKKRRRRPHLLYEFERGNGSDLVDDDLDDAGTARCFCAHRFEQLTHHANVEDVGHVVDGVRAAGHHGGRHQLEN